MESRVLELGIKAKRQELEQEWKSLRRGWYLGQENFAERMGELLDKALAGRQRDSHSGPARQAHDEQAAEALLSQGLKALGMTAAELELLPKGAAEKAVLAWWLRQHTTVRLEWVGRRLAMGHASRVSQAVARMRRRPGRRFQELQRRLQELEGTKPGESGE